MLRGLTGCDHNGAAPRARDPIASAVQTCTRLSSRVSAVGGIALRFYADPALRQPSAQSSA